MHVYDESSCHSPQRSELGGFVIHEPSQLFANETPRMRRATVSPIWLIKTAALTLTSARGRRSSRPTNAISGSFSREICESVKRRYGVTERCRAKLEPALTNLHTHLPRANAAVNGTALTQMRVVSQWQIWSGSQWVTSSAVEGEQSKRRRAAQSCSSYVCARREGAQ